MRSVLGVFILWKLICVFRWSILLLRKLLGLICCMFSCVLLLVWSLLFLVWSDCW